MSASNGKTYEAMRARMPAPEAVAAERSTAEVARIVKDLTGDATPLFVPVMADVENDGNRGPKVPRALTDRDREAADRSLLMARMGKLAAECSWKEVRVVSWMLSVLPLAVLVRACEEATAKGIRKSGENKGMDATTPLETALGDMLGAWDSGERLVLPASEHRKRRQIDDYTSGLVSAEHRAAHVRLVAAELAKPKGGAK